MYRAILGNINDIVLSLDDKGCLTYINPVVEKKLSFQTEEMIGKPLSSFIHPHAEADFREDINAASLGLKKPLNSRFWIRRTKSFMCVSSSTVEDVYRTSPIPHALPQKSTNDFGGPHNIWIIQGLDTNYIPECLAP
jgi:PAS domain S-box-containing protein